jgi:UDP-glucuronate decarboxylase
MQAGNNKPITIYGSGLQTRSFCYVTDLIRGITSLSESENFRMPINIGNPTEFTILELSSLIYKMFPNAPDLIPQQLPVDDPTRRCPDIWLAKGILKWEPKVSLSEGLYKLASEWFEQGIITEKPIQI